MIILSHVAKLYDGRGSDSSNVREKVDVALERGRIEWIRPHNPRAEAPTVVDCQGLTLTPGLVDCHGHITVLGLEGRDIDRMGGAEELLLVEKILHRTLVEGGVTTMRDVGGATDFMKRMVDQGEMIGPRLKISICMLSTTGGHADFRGPDRCHGTLSRMWPEAPGRPSSIVDGVEGCRRRVREIAACGADLVKICTSPGVASPSDRLEHREFTPAELAAICEEASARGLRVAAHAHSASGIELAIEHGVHDIQHISFLDERLVELAAARGCVVTPTSWVMHELPGVEGLSEFVKEKVRQVTEVHAQAVAYAAAGGLPILAGTDPVLIGMHGRNYLEIAALVKDGLKPLQAWHGMTGLAAAEIGQDDTGVLEEGRRADLLVCEGDVLQHPELLDQGTIQEVIKDGVGYRGGLDGIPQRTFRESTDRIWGSRWKG